MSKRGLIYEIICNLTGERYVGSTFENTVARRVSKHRSETNLGTNACSSKTIIERDDYRYGLLETIQVNSRDELRMCERKWYDTLDCINLVKPYASEQELLQNKKECDKKHYEENKNERKQYATEYRIKNIEKVKATQRAYYLKNREQILKRVKEYEMNKKG
jgi:hypothetical protein